MNENENKNKELENQGDTIPPLQMSEEPIISDIAPELKEAIMPTNEPVQETTTEAQQVPPAPAPSPAARKSRKSHPVLISLLATPPGHRSSGMLPRTQVSPKPSPGSR